jgi:hypothetical protein
MILNFYILKRGMIVQLQQGLVNIGKHDTQWNCLCQKEWLASASMGDLTY